MTWILWGIYGAVCLALVNSFFRLNPWGLPFWPLLLLSAIPTTFGTQVGFFQLYQQAPSFFTAWFVGSALSSIAGFTASIFIFHEQPNFISLIGVGLILGGAFLLTK